MSGLKWGFDFGCKLSLFSKKKESSFLLLSLKYIGVSSSQHFNAFLMLSSKKTATSVFQNLKTN